MIYVCCLQQPTAEETTAAGDHCEIIPLYVPGHVMYIQEESEARSVSCVTNCFGSLFSYNIAHNFFSQNIRVCFPLRLSNKYKCSS